MIFKHAYLARLGIQKTFTHGGVQSLVAASQSSSASHNTSFHTLSNNVVNYFGKGSLHQHSQNVQPTLQQNATGAKTGQPEHPGSEEGLAAYYAAWHKHQRAEDREWHQFQFAKRIGWKAPTTIPEPQQEAKPAAKSGEVQHDRLSLGLGQRARSTSAVDDLNKRKDVSPATAEAEEAAALAQVDEAVAKEIENIKNQQTKEAPEASTTSPALSSDVPSPAAVSMQSTDASSQEQSTEATSITEADTYAEHLITLADQQKYGEIPAVFESMLWNGVTPSSSAYNALLLAAINLPKGRHQVVPKVLDVYSDMLRRRVLPDTATYTVLIEVLAARALDVSAMMSDLTEKRMRFGGMDGEGSFLFRSDETEFKILAEDDALSLAIKLFDTSAASVAKHHFTSETYCFLLTACANQGRINDMVRIYAEMESQGVVPPTAIFAPMIKAFAGAGDLRSSVECYDEYKALAIANDKGENIILRKDEEIYAALIQAYSVCGRATGGLKFLGKIEDELQGSDRLAAMRDAIALQALVPSWLEQHRHQDAIAHTSEHLSSASRQQALSAICIDAADNNYTNAASEAFSLLSSGPTITKPAIAMLAMHIRHGDVKSARSTWETLSSGRPSMEMIEPTTIYASTLINSGDVGKGLYEARQSFARIRDQGAGAASGKQDVIEAVDEAIEVLGQYVFKGHAVVSPAASLDLIHLMVENEGIVNSLAERALAVLGPAEISALSFQDVNMLTQVQAGLLLNRAHLDVAHSARFAHLLELVMSSGVAAEVRTAKLIDQALEKLNRPDLTARWQSAQYPPSTPMLAPAQYSNFYSPPQAATQANYEDTYDPYATSTDFKGSTAIADELEKTYGRHASHLNEAMTRFRNMRRAGRHPRYVTYAKLIGAAAKENRINLAYDILAMAKQDVPLLPHSSVVTHGWVSILDAMVGACLTVGKRDAAGQFHQELLNMGTAPSANTFGLYITTLKESTKTFDEATEAVKIFHRAKTEGVEPSSFLYNALIGKLGKARRIDDCLFYFAEMRKQGIRPTSVTYGTIVNALCRVSDEKFAEELFEEMESMPNYKPRPAPYNSMMQYFLTTKRDRTKVLAYYDRMRVNNIEPTMHTFKLLIDTYATLDPVDLPAAERVLEEIRVSGGQPEAVHYASLIHAKGCVLHDLEAARKTFDIVLEEGRIPPQASLYQAIFESMVANHDVAATEPLLERMSAQGVKMTPYIANTLIHGWALAKDINKARAIYDSLGRDNREPSTYEAMTRAYLAVEDHGNAMSVVGEALRRGYPSAVANKICDLVGGGAAARAAT